MDCLREMEGKRVHDPLSRGRPSLFMDCLREMEGKRVHDPLSRGRPCVYMELGPVIVGAGPSGLAVAACLKERGVPSVVLERDNCIASLWQLKTYDRLRLHLPKQFCELPLMPFPSTFPRYPTKQQFVDYLEAYARRFDIRPAFDQTVESAEYDGTMGFWRVRTKGKREGSSAEYLCRWLVVATGENAEPVVPAVEGIKEFAGQVVHTSVYKSGEAFGGKKVLVVGCGNSGMEVCLDLCNYNARPSLVVRDTVHILPQEMLGSSTFGLSMWLLKWFPIHLVDRFLLLASWLTLGDTSRLGLHRPHLGPLQLKNISGKTPVLDVGTLAKIRAGDIKVCPGVKRLTKHGAQFVDGREEDFDAVILATGYRSNVPSWLKEREFFSQEDGYPRTPFPNGWRGQSGLYAVGFTKRGLQGASMDARRIAEDIDQLSRKAETKLPSSFASVQLVQKHK